MAKVDDKVVYVQINCCVCLEVHRELFKVTCCGKSFCKECIVQVKCDRKPCPCCNQENFNNFPNKEEGCEQRGELRQLDNHLNSKLTQTDLEDVCELEGCHLAEIECTFCSEFMPQKLRTPTPQE